VLQRQSAPGRSFLLQTAILDRLSGPLVEAVTGQTDGGTKLQALERANFFLVPLDDQRRWYRYHHLFAEVLAAYLKAEQPDQVALLHGRASVWYEKYGSMPDAVRHALAAEDFARAANLIEMAFPVMTRNRQESTVLAWLKALPEALVRDRPVLCNLYAGALMQTGEIEGVDAWLRAAERWLPPSWGSARPEEPASAMVVVDQTEFGRLAGGVAMHRAGLSLLLGDVGETIKYARKTLDLAPEDDHLRRGGAAVLLGLTLWTNGDLDAAQRMYAEGMGSLQRAGYISDVLGSALALADIRRAQGHLREALRVYERGLQLAAERGTPNLRGTADMLVGMSELYLEQNDLGAGGARRRPRVAAEPASPVRRDGAAAPARRRPGRRRRLARRGRAPIYERLFPKRPPGPGTAGAALGCAGQIGGCAGVGSGGGAHGRGRPELPA
jgi:LuxR family maltose regulon positive regulatory protein